MDREDVVVSCEEQIDERPFQVAAQEFDVDDVLAALPVRQDGHLFRPDKQDCLVTDGQLAGI